MHPQLLKQILSHVCSARRERGSNSASTFFPAGAFFFSKAKANIYTGKIYQWEERCAFSHKFPLKFEMPPIASPVPSQFLSVCPYWSPVFPQPNILAPVVQTMDSAIHRINHYPADKHEQNFDILKFSPRQKASYRGSGE